MRVGEGRWNRDVQVGGSAVGVWVDNGSSGGSTTTPVAWQEQERAQLQIPRDIIVFSSTCSNRFKFRLTLWASSTMRSPLVTEIPSHRSQSGAKVRKGDGKVDGEREIERMRLRVRKCPAFPDWMGLPVRARSTSEAVLLNVSEKTFIAMLQHKIHRDGFINILIRNTELSEAHQLTQYQHTSHIAPAW